MTWPPPDSIVFGWILVGVIGLAILADLALGGDDR